MTQSFPLKSTLLFGLIFMMLTFGLISHANESSSEPGPKLITAEKLGGADRFLTHTSTDKPIYRIGETVYVRTVLLNAQDQKPYAKGHAGLTLKILGPTGDELLKKDVGGQESTFGLSWKIPEGTAGGVHKVVVESPLGFAPKTERSFEIRAYRPRLHDIDITFEKKGYGPTDRVSAKVEIKRADGTVPKGAKVSVIARLDGKEIHREELSFPEKGELEVGFNLPEMIQRGEGTLFVSLIDKGRDSSHGKSLPILLQTLDVSFFPEGGDLLSGTTSKVYFQAWRPDGQPADLKGELFDAKGQSTGIMVQTLHEGRGSFLFTPDDRQLFLKISEPSGIRATYALPRSKKEGGSLHVAAGVILTGATVDAKVETKGVEPGWLTLCKREKVLDRVDLRGKPSGEVVSLNLGEGSGSLIVTLWDVQGLPLSERLVFVHPKEKVHLEIDLKTKSPSPGDRVEVEITAKNDQGEPVEAVVGITVTDIRTQEMIENREQAPRLPAMALLEHEVDDFKDTGAYLGGKDDGADARLDLLLGVQGWRRFLLARDWNRSPKPDEMSQRAFAKVERRFRHHARMFRAKGKNDAGDEMMILERAMPEKAMAVVFEDGVFDGAEVMAMAVGGAVAGLEVGEKEGADVQAFFKENREPRKRKLKAFDIAKERKQAMGAQMVDEMGNFRDENREMNAKMAQMPLEYIILREYAHIRKAPVVKGDRRDFTETLYWHAGKKTDASTGKATLSFQLSDSLTRFQIQADAFTSTGALGSEDGSLDVAAPFHLEPKWPLHLSEGDQVALPVGVVGQTEGAVELSLECDTLEMVKSLSLSSDESRGMITFEAKKSGRHTFTLSGKRGDDEDKVTHTLVISPKGFPIKLQTGGMLKAGQDGELEVPLPPTLQPGSLGSIVRVYPTPQSSLDGALKSLMRQPHGCFEQTSSTSYPLVMAQQYFLSHQGVDPEIIAETRKLLQKGYQRLIGFECKGGGYEWFGRGAGHEGLTAYGLMQFSEMSLFMDIDQAMLKRTRQWLLDRRDGEGSFKKNSKKLDSFGGASSQLTDAYLVWALLESGEAPSVLQKEIDTLMKSNSNNTDPYIQALMANLLHMAGKKGEAGEYLKKLAEAQKSEGHNHGAVTSITSSRGSSLTVETTSLAILAWLKGGEEWMESERKAMDWLHTQGKSGRYGNTQATILALKAIVAHDKAFAKPGKAGRIWLSVGGVRICEPLEFTPESRQTLELPDISGALKPGGEQTLKLHMEGGSPMPFSLEVNYHSPLPPSANSPAIRFTTTLSHDELREGDPTNLKLKVTATQDTPTPILILGLPGGLELRHDQLKSWVKSGKIASYETGEGILALYWRGLKEGQVVDLPIDLIANLPGTYQSASSLAYPYYEEENVHWEKGTQVTIFPR